jgi:RimJ/RimL family protein N-acetyltransferase
VTEPVTLTAGDLVLRPWRPADRPRFAALNADPEVMRHFSSTQTTEQSNGMVDRIEAAMARDGWGLWALDAPGLGFVGFVGLARPNFTAWFTSPEASAVEVGWRLARSAWGKGWASTAAATVLRYGFTQAGLPEIVSFTTVQNEPSRRVMEKLGLAHDPADDFDHPRFLHDDRIRPHVLYRLDAAGFAAHEADPGLRRLAQHVGAFNAGVRTGSWGPMLRGCTEDVSLELAGRSTPAATGRAAVEAAYRAEPPTAEIVVTDVRRDGDEVVARWRTATPSGPPGGLRLLLRGDLVAGMRVSFDR